MDSSGVRLRSVLSLSQVGQHPLTARDAAEFHNFFEFDGPKSCDLSAWSKPQAIYQNPITATMAPNTRSKKRESPIEFLPNSY